MTKKFLVALLLVVAVVSSAFAVNSPVPPSKGQWGFALAGELPLYKKADADADSEYVSFDGKWFKVPSAIRDDDNYLWYKVTIDKKTGWLAQNGVRLKLSAGKSKAATNLYKNRKKSPLSNLIGLSQDEIRSKLGTPTMRETPYNEMDINILSYELNGVNKTLVIHIEDDEVITAEFLDGRAGQTDDD